PLIVNVRCEYPIAPVFGRIGRRILRVRNLTLDLCDNALKESSRCGCAGGRIQAGEGPITANNERRPGVLALARGRTAELETVCPRIPDHVIAKLEPVRH